MRLLLDTHVFLWWREASPRIQRDVAPLAITIEHTERVATLPRHHGDPFDRMLAAQTLHEGLTLVTHDRAFAPYAVPVLWA